jgi:hypothetical protein
MRTCRTAVLASRGEKGVRLVIVQKLLGTASGDDSCPVAIARHEHLIVVGLFYRLCSKSTKSVKKKL